MKEIKFRDETIKVLEAAGYNDGYYWDMNATVEFRGELYHIVDGGSGSGYIPCFTAIKKGELDRLYGEEQGYIDDDKWNWFERAICRLMTLFIESGAETSYSCQGDSFWDVHVFIDGVELEVSE